LTRVVQIFDTAAMAFLQNDTLKLAELESSLQTLKENVNQFFLIIGGIIIFCECELINDEWLLHYLTKLPNF
jgi:hypothetical protein